MQITKKNYYYRKPRGKKKSSKYKTWIYRLVKIGFSLWFLYLFLGGQYGLVKIIALYTNIKNTEKATEKMEAERIILSEKCRRLQTDPFTIEKIAREKLAMIKEGEVVYKIIQKR